MKKWLGPLISTNGARDTEIKHIDGSVVKECCRKPLPCFVWVMCFEELRPDPTQKRLSLEVGTQNWALVSDPGFLRVYTLVKGLSTFCFIT